MLEKKKKKIMGEKARRMTCLLDVKKKTVVTITPRSFLVYVRHVQGVHCYWKVLEKKKIGRKTKSIIATLHDVTLL